MPISRRRFFGQFLGSQEESANARRERLAALDSRLRSELLPYDFTLSELQTASLFAEIQARILVLTDEELRDENTEAIRRTLEAEMIQPWREAHWKADERRGTAAGFVPEFLTTQVSPEGLHRLRHRFNMPSPAVVDEVVQRHARDWLESLPDARLLELDAPMLRDLVFSELRSWC